MRGTIEGMVSPHPLGRMLPAVYQDDEFTQQLCAALDEVVASIIGTLDSMPAYFDPGTTPDDMLFWLSSWMGIVIDRHQPVERQRQLVLDGAELLRWRGTVRGVRMAVNSLFPGDAEISEEGGVSWSVDPTGPVPTVADNVLLVRLGRPKQTVLDGRRLDELIGLVKPAHIPHRVEIYPLDTDEPHRSR